jgi:hypothetical protein
LLERLGESEQGKRILDAVERDGEKFFNLIRRTLEYERVLQGVDSGNDGSDMDIPGHIGHRMQALRGFAAFLTSNIQHIPAPLSLAIERDGKQLFHLAECCLLFESVVGGGGSGGP